MAAAPNSSPSVSGLALRRQASSARAACRNTACADPCGGRWVTSVPTATEDGQEEKGNQMSKDEGGWNSSFSEKPVRSRLRRLVDWINLTGAKKVHSLIDKVYKRKNLEMAWEKVKENRGSEGNLRRPDTQTDTPTGRCKRTTRGPATWVL